MHEEKRQELGRPISFLNELSSIVNSLKVGEANDRRLSKGGKEVDQLIVL